MSEFNVLTECDWCNTEVLCRKIINAEANSLVAGDTYEEWILSICKSCDTNQNKENVMSHHIEGCKVELCGGECLIPEYINQKENTMNKKCCAITKAHESCKGFKVVEVNVLTKGGQAVHPDCYNENNMVGWFTQSLPFCFSHQGQLDKGKKVDILPPRTLWASEKEAAEVVAPVKVEKEVKKVNVKCNKGHQHDSIEDARVCMGLPVRGQKRSGDWFLQNKQVRKIANPYKNR